MYQLPKSHDLGVNTCAACFEKQREIDRLREEVTRLKGAARATVSVKRRRFPLLLQRLPRRFLSKRTPPSPGRRSAAAGKSVTSDMDAVWSPQRKPHAWSPWGCQINVRSVAQPGVTRGGENAQF